MNQQTIDKARREYNNNGYYERQLQSGLEFQDVVTKALYQRGIIVIGYASRRFQNSEGENMLGAEIKRDDLFRKTGNLYIEVAEKSHPDNTEYSPSGIFRKDNSWLYVIGDEKTIYIFSTKWLRKLIERYELKVTATSIGRVMPIKEAEHICIRKIDL